MCTFNIVTNIHKTFVQRSECKSFDEYAITIRKMLSDLKADLQFTANFIIRLENNTI